MSQQDSTTIAAVLNARVIQEQFDIIRPTINGLLALASMGTPQRPEEGSKLNWLDMSVGADTITLTAEASAIATTLSVDDGSKARAGMLLFVASTGEYLVVTSSDATANTVVAIRGQGGSTAAIIPDTTVISIESIAREEGSQASSDGIYQPIEVENLFQTMDTGVDFTRRALSSAQHGNTNDMAFQTNERLRQLMIQMNKTLLRGRKMSILVGGKITTYTGGLGYFLDQAGAISVGNAAAALTLEAINALQAEVKSRGGMVDSIVVGIPLARVLQSLANAQYGSQTLANFVSDQGGLTRLPSDLPIIGGMANIVVDTNMSDTELYLIDSSRLSIIPMAAGNAADSGAWRTIDSTQNGQDGQSVRIIGDFGIQVRDSKTNFARLTNIGA